MRSSHSLDRLDTAFDDDRLVADAGLLLPATLAQHLGLRELVEKHVHRGQPLVIEGQYFEAVLEQFAETAERGGSAYEAHFRLKSPQINDRLLLGITFHEGNETWSSSDLAELAIREILGLPVGPRPSMSRPAAAIDWRALVAKAHRNPHLLAILGELIAGEALLASGALTRVTQLEVRLVGPPDGLVVRVAGVHAPWQGAPTQSLSIEGLVSV